jgi:hypothetical protein
MGSETEAQVWCDGPKSNPNACPNGNSEFGPSITAVRAFLKPLGWVVRRRNGEKVDMCPICKEEK